MRFYLSYTNRRGNDYGAGLRPGTSAHTRGWNAGVKVFASESELTGRDEFDVWMTTGSHDSGSAIHLGSVQDTPDGPQWLPVPGRTAGPTAEDHGLARNALQRAIDVLMGGDCTFWACNGPDAPFVPMATCRRCGSIQDLRAELARISPS